MYTLTQILENYDVKGYTRSRDALESLKAGDSFDILLIDFRMEGITGLDLLYEAKKRLPAYKAILITAYSNKELLEQVINNDLIFRVVNKPFEPEELCELVDEALSILRKEQADKDHHALLARKIGELAGTAGRSKQVLIHSCSVMQDLLTAAKKLLPSI